MVYISQNRNDPDRYDDIIDTAYPFEKDKDDRRMSVKDRAAQFSPFAALTGFDERIETETERFSEQEG